MSQENVGLAYLAFAAINRRDLDALLALMGDEVEAVSRIVAMERPLASVLVGYGGGTGPSGRTYVGGPSQPLAHM